MDFSAYEFSSLQEGQFTLHRGLSDGLEPILLVACSDEYPSPGRSSGSSMNTLSEPTSTPTGRRGRSSLFVARVGLTLVLEDPGGEPLERLLGRPLDITHFLRIAVPLAAALGRVHAQGLIHKDIKPANILVDAASGGVWLTGFGIASRLPRERQAPRPPEVIAGTLAYMAPEQTGRMNRSVDSRSDLYALGVTFYEMLTGALPFIAADPMEWVHCHIARQPVPPSERSNGVPAPLSAIVMKLLAKTAEERYQTAAGLEADLRRCLAEWEAHGRIEPFPLGAHDASDRLLIPEKLYGREREIDTLLAAFDRVVADGAPELVLVSGYSGIGKSSVVNELHKALVPPRGLFASGKFDQYKRDIPYATLAQAFQSLVRPLLGQERGRARPSGGTRCGRRLGPNGQLIVNLVPELELVIGKQPPVAGPAAAGREEPLPDGFPALPRRVRAQGAPARAVPRRFAMAGCSDARPPRAPGHALRGAAPAAGRRLPGQRGRPRAPAAADAGGDPRRRSAGPGDRAGAARTRRCRPARRRCPALRAGARAAVGAAGAREDRRQSVLRDPVLHGAGRRGAARVRPGRAGLGNGTWIASAPRATPTTSWISWSEKLKRLSATTQEALKQLACLGNVAEIATLALVHGQPEEAMHAALWEAVHAGLVFREDSAYKFLHDRIQQAAYSLIPERAPRRSPPAHRPRAAGEHDGGRARRASVRCREPVQSGRRAAGRPGRESAGGDDQPARRAKGQGVGGLCVGARVFCGRHGAVGRKRLGQPVRVDVQPVARTRGVRVSDR